MFFERPDTGEKVILVHMNFNHHASGEDSSEFYDLAISSGVEVMAYLHGKRNQPDPGLFIGRGKLDELLAEVRDHQAEVVLFNHSLSPSQERNLERELKCRVLDRTGLILDIFAQRARTHEGKLQVELAQLNYMSTRLVRGWTHLERQKGGIGLRGPGETQLETDRRLLRHRIHTIEKRLEKVRKQRQQNRRARQRREVPSISLVGYTNAGKSTLFNRLTEAEVYAADQLFATLDPTLRKLTLKGVGPCIFADTVGFIRDLPHKLVEAFRATLEETTQASLLLHVVDQSSADKLLQQSQVNSVLEEIEAHEIPQLVVLNKIDNIEDAEPRIDRDEQGRPIRVWCSAKTGAGLDLVKQAISECLSADIFQGDLALPPAMGKLRAQLYHLGAIQEEQVDDQGFWYTKVCLPRSDFDRLLRQQNLQVDQLLARRIS